MDAGQPNQAKEQNIRVDCVQFTDLAANIYIMYGCKEDPKSIPTSSDK